MPTKFAGRRPCALTVAIAVSLLATGCGSSAKDAIGAGPRQTESSVSETSTSTPETAAMPRLNRPVTLYDGKDQFVPPLPTDTTSLTVAEMIRGFETSPLTGPLKTAPVVFLARFTNTVTAAAPAFAGATAPYPATDPHDRLVVAVIAYGRPPHVGGAEGQSAPVHAQPTNADPGGETIMWTYDPVTGRALWGANFPGPVPKISTSASDS